MESFFASLPRVRADLRKDERPPKKPGAGPQILPARVATQPQPRRETPALDLRSDDNGVFQNELRKWQVAA